VVFGHLLLRILLFAAKAGRHFVISGPDPKYR
jgi:hypothetical protein